MAMALKGRPVLHFPMPPGVTMAPWDSGCGTVTDAFKPAGARRLDGAIGSGVGAAGADGGTGAAPRSRCMAGSTTAWAGCIDPRPVPRSMQLTVMSAESDALNEQIKQSVALLRRHL